MPTQNVFQVILAAGSRVSAVKDRISAIAGDVAKFDSEIAAADTKLSNLGESAKRIRAEGDIAHIFARLAESFNDWSQAKAALDPANRAAQKELFNALNNSCQISLVGAKGQKKETVGAGTALGRVGHDQYRGWLEDNNQAEARTALTAAIEAARTKAAAAAAVVDGLDGFVNNVEGLITEAATASPQKGGAIAKELEEAVTAAEAVIAEFDKPPEEPTPAAGE